MAHLTVSQGTVVYHGTLVEKYWYSSTQKIDEGERGLKFCGVS